MVGWALRAGGAAARAGLATAARSGLLLRPATAPSAAPRLSRCLVGVHGGAPGSAAAAAAAVAGGGAHRHRLLSSSPPARSTAAAEAAEPPAAAAAASSGGQADEAGAPVEGAAAAGEADAAAAVPPVGDADAADAAASSPAPSSSSSSSSTAAADAGAGTSVGAGAEFISRPKGQSMDGVSSLVSVASSLADAALLGGPRPSVESLQLEREVGKLLAGERYQSVAETMLTALRDRSVRPTRRTFIMALKATTGLSWASASITIYEASRRARVAFGLNEYNALLRTLARVGAVDRMRAVIDEMWAAGGGAAPDTRSYDQLITALAVSRGHSVKDALDVTDEMRAKGVMPSVGTYERFVAACVAGKKVRMATATLAAMNDQGVAANARTYATVISAAADGNLSQEVASLLRLAQASLGPYARYLRKVPANNPRFRNVHSPSPDTDAGAGADDGAAAPPSGAARGAVELKPRLEVGILIASMAAASRTNDAALAGQVWAIARSAAYADWTPPAPFVQALLSARSGGLDIPAAFDAVDEMVALGYDANAVRCRALINALSKSPQAIDDGWYHLLARKAAAAGEGAPAEASEEAADDDAAAAAAADADDATEETPADADGATEEAPAAADDADAAADAASPTAASVGAGIFGGPGVPSAPTVAHLNVLLRACSLAGDAVRAKQTFDAAEAELGVVPDAFSYIALSRAQLGDRDAAASMATLDTLAAASDTIARSAEAADEAMSQRVLLFKLSDRLDDAVVALREHVDATAAALAGDDAAASGAAAAAVLSATSLPFKFLARRARQVKDDSAEAEVLRLAAVAGFDPADVASYVERRPRAKGGGNRGRAGGDRYQGGGGRDFRPRFRDD